MKKILITLILGMFLLSFISATNISIQYGVNESSGNFIPMLLNDQGKQKIDFNFGNFTGRLAQFINITVTSNANIENLIVNKNASANWFKGLFNWITGDTWNIFNGSTLTFNKTKADDRWVNSDGDNITGNLNSTANFSGKDFFGSDFWTTSEHGDEIKLTEIGGIVLHTADDTMTHHTNLSISSIGGIVNATANNEQYPGESIDYIVEHTHYEIADGSTVTLTKGTWVNPQTNYIYVDTDQILKASTTPPSGEFAWLGIVEIANATGTDVVYYANQDEIPTTYESIKNTYERAWYDNPIYETGMSINFEGNNISTSSGSLRFGITSVSYSARNVTDGTYYVWVSDPTSAYSIHNTLYSITTYQDGGSIGNTKYFNVVIYGLVEDEINGRSYYFNVQDEPAIEYNSISQAESDLSGKTNYQCPTRFARTCFPIARVVLKRNTGAGLNEIQTLSSGLTFIQLLDENLIIFGGTSSVALGLDEVIANNPNTDKNIISTANGTFSFLFADGSQLTGILGSQINNNLNWINITQGITAGFNSTFNETYNLWAYNQSDGIGDSIWQNNSGVAHYPGNVNISGNSTVNGFTGLGNPTSEYLLRVGSGTTLKPVSNLGSSSVVIYDNISVGRTYIEGNDQADIILVDNGATVDERVMQLVNINGITKFRGLNDATGISVDNILVMDHTTGYLGIGTTPDAGRIFHVEDSSDLTIRFETTNVNGYSELELVNDVQNWKMGVDNSDNFRIRDQTDTTTAITIQNGTQNIQVGGDSTTPSKFSIKAPSGTDDVDMIGFSEDGTNDAFVFTYDGAGAESTGNSLVMDSHWTENITVWRGDGNVGIGTSSPEQLAHFQGPTTAQLNYALKMEAGSSTNDASAVGILFNNGNFGSNRGKGALVYRDDGTTWNRGSFYFLNDAAEDGNNAALTDAVMVIRNTGSVGIGTTDPAGKVTISAGTSGNYDALTLVNSHAFGVGQGTHGSRIVFTRDTGGEGDAPEGAVIESGNSVETTSHGNYLNFSILDSGGNLVSGLFMNRFADVGIGTNPTSGRKLHIVEPSAAAVFLKLDTSSSGYNAVLELAEAGTRRAYINYDATNHYSEWKTEEAGSDIILSPNGNVGVDELNPASDLSVGGSGFSTYGIYGQGSSNGIYGNGSVTGIFGLGGTLGIQGNGGVWDFVASNGVYYLATAPPAAVGGTNLCWDGSGASLIGTCTSLTEHKRDIVNLTMTSNLWNKYLNVLQPSAYYFKNKNWTQGRQGGFLAENVVQVHEALGQWTERINKTDNSTIRELTGVNYDAISALNTLAVQDLKKENDDLKTRLDKIEQMLNVSIPEPEQTKIWTCQDKPEITYEQNECQPKTDQRRCYYAVVFYHYCKTGWELI